MQIQVEQAGLVTVVRPVASRLDVEVAARFRAELLELIAQGRRQLVIDLQEVAFVDSSGLGAMVSALKTIKRATPAGDVRLARAQSAVVSLLEIIRLNRVLAAYPDIALAVESFEPVSAIAVTRVERPACPSRAGL
jgi:anti-sigma B factor antagonist